MSKVDLYENGVRVGGVHFRSLAPMDAAAYTIDPPHILLPSEVEEIRLRLCHLPQTYQGTVGKYEWREVRP